MLVADVGFRHSGLSNLNSVSCLAIWSWQFSTKHGPKIRGAGAGEWRDSTQLAPDSIPASSSSCRYAWVRIMLPSFTGQVTSLCFNFSMGKI